MTQPTPRPAAAPFDVTQFHSLSGGGVRGENAIRDLGVYAAPRMAHRSAQIGCSMPYYPGDHQRVVRAEADTLLQVNTTGDPYDDDEVPDLVGSFEEAAAMGVVRQPRNEAMIDLVSTTASSSRRIQPAE